MHAACGLTILLVACSAQPLQDPGPFEATGSGGGSAGGSTAFSETGGSPGSVFATGGSGAGVFMAGMTRESCGAHDVTVLFLLDRSGSMNCNLPPTTTSSACEAMSPPAKVDLSSPSKWEAISTTVSKSLDRLVPTDPAIHVRVGAAYFSVDGMCGARSLPAVPVGDATPAQFDLIRQSVASQEPEGGTPIVAGTMLAYKHLYQTLQVTGDAHVILLTDGADSCAQYYASNPAIGTGDHVADLLGVQAPKAYGFGISTWVIGAPGSEPARAMLSKLAVAGGTRRSDDCIVASDTDPSVGDCHYDMTTGDFEAGLGEALTHIMDVATCVIPH